MKNLKKLVKYNIKFLPFILALIISFSILKNSCSDNQLISNINSKSSEFPEDEILDCTYSIMIRLFDIILKCSFAFLVGSWVSEGKYIRFGAI